VPTPAPTPVHDPEQVQQIVESTRDIFSRAAQPPRWPMYVRQFKQFLRGVDSTFDERKWGFGTIMEFLRVCQREGLFRLERDRRGQIRVFPGSGLQTSATGVTAPVAPEQERADIRDAYEAELVASSEGSDASGRRSLDEGGQSDFQGDEQLSEEQVSADAPVVEVIEIDEQPAPVKARRTRKAPTAGKPTARKSTGARTSTTRRKKVPAPAA